MLYTIVQTMILDYIKFKKFQLTSEIPVFLIHGNPRNISNEIEHDIINFHKKLKYKFINYVIDDDTQTEEIKNNLLEQSLFEDKKILTLNIVSNTIPTNLKKLIDLWAGQHNNDKLIIKVDRQVSSFKKTNLYKNLIQNACVIEIYELKGRLLEQWIENKCKINDIDYNTEFISNLIDTNFNNSFSISQTIYLKSLIKDNHEEIVSSNSRYTEYDLIDKFLSKDLKGFILVSSYLKASGASLPYIIFLINSELEKLYSVLKPISSKPYIPEFLKSKYINASKNYTLDGLIYGLKNIVNLDIDSKYRSKRSAPWTSFNSLFLNLMSST
tara:strand:+ start:429 stop:1409 length:981 start_codon:yes stop_codon:yes gene_type:complete